MNRLLTLGAAGAILGLALLAIFDLVPEDIARYGVIALPALAVVSMRGCNGCGLFKGKSA